MDFNIIYRELSMQHLSEVFPAIRQKAASVGSWEVAEQVENLWMTFQQMVQFMLDGVKDAHSQQIREKICLDLGIVAVKLERLERLKNNPHDKYASTLKSLHHVSSFAVVVDEMVSVATALNQLAHDELMRETVRQHQLELLEEEHETALMNLFNWVWTSEVWQNSDRDQANRVLFSDEIDSNDKAVLVSAVTLSLFEYCDAAKALFLFDCYLVEDEQVSQRALVGIVLMLCLFYQRFEDNEELRDRLTIHQDDDAFIHDLYATMMLLQMSCTTDSVTSKMRNDIIPAIMQGQMRQPNKNAPLNPNDLAKNGENPEWIDIAKADKKMREMAELQLDGADIYYSSFAMLKGHSFFSQLPHWFYPFSFDRVQVPEIKQVLNGKMGRLMKLLLSSSPFCNSDKYSLCFTFKSLGSIGEAAMEAQINQQLGGENIDNLISDAMNVKPKKTDIRRQYIFDLYRFFYSYPYKQQFLNPFALLKENPVTPYTNMGLSMLLAAQKEELAQYADFLMRKEFYSTALRLFESLYKNEFEAQYASLWQKIGFCHQKLAQVDEAIRAYKIANQLKPRSKWTLSHLASLSLSAGEYDNTMDAVQFYQELLEIDPDNQKYLMNISQALIALEDFDKAQPYLYKALYLDEDSIQLKLMLSWCLIATGQNEKAAKYLLEVQAVDAQNEEAQVLFVALLLIDGKIRDAYNLCQSIINDDNGQSVLDRLYVFVAQEVLDSNVFTLFTDALILNMG